MSIKIEEVESLPPETPAIELQPGITYLILVSKRAVSQETCRRIPGAFEKMGLRPPMILTVLDPEKDVKLYALKKDSA